MRGEKGESVKVGIKVLMDSVDNVSIYSNSSTGKTFSWNLIWWEMYIHLEKKNQDTDNPSKRIYIRETLGVEQKSNLWILYG